MEGGRGRILSPHSSPWLMLENPNLSSCGLGSPYTAFDHYMPNFPIGMCWSRSPCVSLGVRCCRLLRSCRSGTFACPCLTLHVCMPVCGRGCVHVGVSLPHHPSTTACMSVCVHMCAVLPFSGLLRRRWFRAVALSPQVISLACCNGTWHVHNKTLQLVLSECLTTTCVWRGQRWTARVNVCTYRGLCSSFLSSPSFPPSPPPSLSLPLPLPPSLLTYSPLPRWVGQPPGHHPWRGVSAPHPQGDL